MRIPVFLLAGAALALSACDTMYGPPPPPPPPPGPAGAATLTTATKAPFGTYVVDGSGRSVYALIGTRGASGVNRCSGRCLDVWPPLPSGVAPVTASGLDAAQVRSVSGYRGAQVSYSGWPLYYYARDVNPQDTTGQGVQDQWGTWYLLSPSGEPVGPRPY